MLRRLLVLLTAAWAVLAPLTAQDKKVSVHARFTPATARPGDEVVLEVELKIDDGWHVYGRDEETGIPPSLTLTEFAGLTAVGATKVPFGVPHDSFGIKSYWVKDRAVLQQTLKLPTDARGELLVKGRADYMVCNEESCLPPDSDLFTARLEVDAPATQEPSPASPTSAPTPAAPTPAEPTEDQKVTAVARFVPSTVRPGDTAVLEVALRILDGWHVYGRDEETGIPPNFTLTKPGGLTTVGAVEVPLGTPHDSFGIQSFWVKDQAVLRQTVKVPADARGAVEVQVHVDYMACNEEMCDPPSDLQATATLLVDADAAAPVTSGGAPGLGLQDPFDFGATSTAPTFRARLEPDLAHPGEVVDVIVSVTVPDGYHVYGAKDENPIKLRATDANGLVAEGQNRLPDGKEHRSGTLVNYWVGGGFELRQAYRVPADASAGTLAPTFKIDYLVCDENTCLPQGVETISLPLRIEAGAVRAEYAGAAPSGGPDGGWLKLLLAAVAAGLFALLMPCTYPMIPITISVFAKQAEARGGKVLPLSLTYGIGIVAMFVVIGVVVGPAIVPFATHWLTNAVIAVAFVFFAFSLFGWVTIQPPRFLMNAAGKAQTRGGYVGVLLMGATLVVTSFTCTVPFVASLLALASRGGFLHMVAGMAMFGLTMAIPFVALSMVPGRMRGIPRAGEWMNTLKVFLGFVELAAALKFVSSVDLVINDGPLWLTRTVFLWLWVAIFVAAGLYLLRGFLVPAQKAGLKRAAGVVLSLAFAGWCAYGATGHDLDSVMTAIAPPKSKAESGARHQIIKDDYEKAIEAAKASNRLVLVNFTGFT